MRVVGELVGVLALGVAGVKWLRVAQREHYLPGSVISLCRVWWRSAWHNRLAGLLPVVAGIGWVRFSEQGWLGQTVWPLVAAVGVALYPVGLSLRGRTSPLVWTARLKRLAVFTVLALGVVSVAVVALVGTVTPRSGLWGVFSPVGVVLLIPIMDLALWGAAPLERRLTSKFVRQARDTLTRVGPTVVGITGSYGKTSTKWYVSDLVEGSKRVLASPASFNNRLGLARAVNDNLTADAQVFVAEMGTYGPGEIADLCCWIPPDIAVITAIGPVHLQRFGSVERILAAKREITESAPVVVLNVDYPQLAWLADELSDRKVWRCGSTAEAVDVRVVREPGHLSVLIAGEPVGEVSAPGAFVANLACAVAVALQLGVLPSDLIARANALSEVSHRQSISRSPAGFEIVDDTFNSNPAGAARALEVLLGLGTPMARRVVVTPGMVEIGSQQFRENARFATAACRRVDDFVIVGATNRRALRSGARAGVANVVHARNREQAVAWVRENLKEGDAVLYENDLPDHYP